MNEYREAWCIELYDALLYIQGVSDASGLSFYGEIPGYTIEGEGLENIIKHFPQIELGSVVEENSQLKKSYRTSLSDRSLRMYRQMRLYGSDYTQEKIVRIEAKIEDAQLLHISVFLQDGDARWTDTLTYSGRYSIHWAPQEDKPTE